MTRAPSKFRLWVHNLWLENKEEHFQFGEAEFSLEEYWNKYKHYIRKMYRDQSKQQS